LGPPAGGPNHKPPLQFLKEGRKIGARPSVPSSSLDSLFFFPRPWTPLPLPPAGRRKFWGAKNRRGYKIPEVKGQNRNRWEWENLWDGEAESQWIVAARLLCHLQYLVPYLSRLQRIHLPDRLELWCKAPGDGRFGRSGGALDACFWGRTSAPTGSRVTTGEVESAASSMDSDLEAFSHNPTHGSFASLAFQPNAMTNYVNQRFLSY
jgi:hypothetical protein